GRSGAPLVSGVLADGWNPVAPHPPLAAPHPPAYAGPSLSPLSQGEGIAPSPRWRGEGWGEGQDCAWAVLGAMELLLQQVLAGLATGAIYASRALAVVMIYQAIDHLNFAQGEMAMFSTFLAWQMLQWGWPYWAAFIGSVALSFVGGIAIERVRSKPIQNAPILSQLAAFIALYGILNSSAGWIWDFNIKTFPTPF